MSLRQPPRRASNGLMELWDCPYCGYPLNSFTHIVVRLDPSARSRLWSIPPDGMLVYAECVRGHRTRLKLVERTTGGERYFTTEEALMESTDINNRFDYHPPQTPETVSAHEQVRAACRDLAHDLNDLLPEGREKSLAITHLEDTMMWANAAIARNGGPAVN